ncbi:MAG: ABC transporter permease [Pseudonocardiaceae bacterium]
MSTRSPALGKRRDVWVTAAAGLTVALVALGTLIPLGMVLRTAFGAGALPHYAQFIASGTSRTTLRNTVVLGLLVGLCGTALGFLFAYVQARLDVPFKRTLHVITLIPIVSPPFAVATAAIVLYGRNGLISHGVLGLRYDIYGLDGLVLVLSLSCYPVAYLGLLGMMRALDPSLEETAMDLGATRWQVFRTVQLPLLAPGLAAPFLLLFVEAIADLANPLVLGGDYTVLASSAYFAVTGEFDTTSAAVYSVILLVPTVGLFIAQRYWLAGKIRTTVTGKPAGSVHLIDGWARWPLFALALMVGAVMLSLYVTIILGAITKIFGINQELTLEHFREVLLGTGRHSVTDTVLLATIATPIAGLMGMVLAWLVVRHLRAAALWLDLVSMFGIAVPGTVLGIGYVLAYHTNVTMGPVTVLPALVGGSTIFGGALAIVLCYVARSLPTGQRTATAALTQLHPSIEEASANLGAGHGTTFWHITLPLIRPALLTGLCHSFAHSMTSVSAVVFLVTPHTHIMTSRILDAVNSGRYGVAFAYCTVLTVIILLSFGLIRLILGGDAVLSRVDVTRTRGD